MFLIILFALAFSYPTKASAQIPIFYQLIQAYRPSTHRLPSRLLYPSSSPAPSPVSKPEVLGVESPSVSLPAIGGEGKIITVIVLGDSMIDTLQPGLPQLESALKKLYPHKRFNIVNYGVGASNIEYALFRLTNDYQYLDQKYPSLISLNPDIVVIESFAYNNFGNSPEGIDRQWLGLGAVTTVIKEKLPQSKIVLAATIAPNSIIFGNGIPGVQFSALEKIEKTKTVKLYLQNLVNFATSQSFPLANAYHPSLENGEGKKEYINPNDGLHPSGPGGEFFCQAVAQTIFDHRLVD